ncbi:MAG: NADH-quinone oxidoreductase subunit E [Phyllobacteriaceae bacterium]|nr:NADH-quinone oxidoreductase subunit E [Phyllobacteriaceae bacterium]
MPEPWNLKRARAIAAAQRRAGATAVPLLAALAAAFGRLGEEAVDLLVETLGVDRFSARGLMLFHRDVREHAGQPHAIRVCRGERCRARGCEALGDRIAMRLGVPWYGRSADGRWSFVPVYCQGMCDHGPTACVDDIPFPRLDAIGADGLVDLMEAIDRDHGG